MKINTKIIKNLNPCKSRFDNYLQHYSYFDGKLEDFVLLDKITYADKLWVITRLFTKEQNVIFAIKCAISVLSIFESKYPNNKRPRLALEAAEAWLNNPTEENRKAANAAAAAARAAAAGAANAAARAANAAARAADAAYDATDAAAYSAADTACAAYSATAAYAAAAAAYAAADAAYAATAADAEREIQEELNLRFAVEVSNG